MPNRRSLQRIIGTYHAHIHRISAKSPVLKIHVLMELVNLQRSPENRCWLARSFIDTDFTWRNSLGLTPQIVPSRASSLSLLLLNSVHPSLCLYCSIFWVHQVTKIRIVFVPSKVETWWSGYSLFFLDVSVHLDHKWSACCIMKNSNLVPKTLFWFLIQFWCKMQEQHCWK